eukprot:15391-Rhodomonas_salina.1
MKRRHVHRCAHQRLRGDRGVRAPSRHVTLIGKTVDIDGETLTATVERAVEAVERAVERGGGVEGA